MKMYFLVEGKGTEMKVYPNWLKEILPRLEYFRDYESFKNSESGIYLFSGEGYPSILNHIENSVKDICDLADVDYFFIILDCDESTIEERKKEVDKKLSELEIPKRLEVSTLVQKRCFETILLGNKKVIPRAPNTERMQKFRNYYDVSSNDPERMGNYSSKYTHSQFHSAYVRAAFVERKMAYSKSNPRSVMDKSYLDELVKRIDETQDLINFSDFIEKLRGIAKKHKLYE